MITITNRATDPKTGLTLGELAVFVQDCLRADLDTGSRIHVSIGWSPESEECL